MLPPPASDTTPDLLPIAKQNHGLPVDNYSGHHVCAGHDDHNSHVSPQQSEEPPIPTSTCRADAAIPASACAPDELTEFIELTESIVETRPLELTELIKDVSYDVLNFNDPANDIQHIE